MFNIYQHVLLNQGGLCLDLSKMNNIISVNAEDFDCCVESGVSRLTLNNYIRDTGLWFPIGKFFNLSAGPSFLDFWGQKNSPTPKEKQKKIKQD